MSSFWQFCVFSCQLVIPSMVRHNFLNLLRTVCLKQLDSNLFCNILSRRRRRLRTWRSNTERSGQSNWSTDQSRRWTAGSANRRTPGTNVWQLSTDGTADEEFHQSVWSTVESVRFWRWSSLNSGKFTFSINRQLGEITNTINDDDENKSKAQAKTHTR